MDCLGKKQKYLKKCCKIWFERETSGANFKNNNFYSRYSIDSYNEKFEDIPLDHINQMNQIFKENTLMEME